MKQITMLVALALFINGSVMAQKTRIGFQAGAVLSNQRITMEDISGKGDTRLGITLGLMLDNAIAENIAFQTGINFVSKGYKDKVDDYTETISLSYLEVPLNFMYRQSEQKGFFVGAGPSLAIGINGRWKNDEEKGDLKFGGDDADYTRMDVGANVIAGYLFEKIQVAVNYNRGITNNIPEGNDIDVKLRNHYFGVRIGYFFN